MQDSSTRLEEVDLSLVDFTDQPRTVFDEGKIRELADAIAEDRLLQPPLVRPNPDGSGRYIVIYGERRIRALRLLNRKTERLFVYYGETDGFDEAAAENFNRVDLDPIDQANVIRKSLDRGRTSEQIARRLGRTEPTIRNTVRLLELPPEIQELVREGKVTKGMARNLVQYKGPSRDLIELAATLVSGQDLTPEQEGLLRGDQVKDGSHYGTSVPREPYDQLLKASEGVRRTATVVNSIIALLSMSDLAFGILLKRFPRPARETLLLKLDRVILNCTRLAARIRSLSPKDELDQGSIGHQVAKPGKEKDDPEPPDPLPPSPATMPGIPDKIVAVLGREVFIVAQGILFALLRGNKSHRVNLSSSRLQQDFRLTKGEAVRKAVAAFQVAGLYWNGSPPCEDEKKPVGDTAFKIFVDILKRDSDYGSEDFESFLVRILELDRSKDPIDLDAVLSKKH